MDESAFHQPTAQQIQGFVEGDPIAVNVVVRTVLPQIYRWALRQYSNLDPGDVQSTTHQVFAEVCLGSSRYDPSKATITTYVIYLLKLRLVDKHHQQKRRREFEESLDDTRENQAPALYNPEDGTAIETRLAKKQFFEQLFTDIDNQDRAFLELMRQGEKEHELFAEVLRKSGHADTEKDVKNAKERLIRTLRAAARKHGYRLTDILES